MAKEQALPTVTIKQCHTSYHKPDTKASKVGSSGKGEGCKDKQQTAVMIFSSNRDFEGSNIPLVLSLLRYSSQLCSWPELARSDISKRERHFKTKLSQHLLRLPIFKMQITCTLFKFVEIILNSLENMNSLCHIYVN